jgi:DNA-binding HxlR family transcriptional regulator
VQRTASLIDGKWTLLIIRDLLTGEKRYCEMQRSLAGISLRLLAMRLRALESQHIINRRVFSTRPPSTEYELRVKG